MRKLIVLLLVCTPLWAQAAPKSPTDKIVDTFMGLDVDVSTGVSLNEYMRMVKQRARGRFARMDRNHDGEVSAKEYRYFWHQEQSAYYRLQR
ncbi:MAG: thymidylate synthase [Mariprofundaceae bacterium]|nr:thymidylate synthase [Mariprofundaceae bacterium]